MISNSIFIFTVIGLFAIVFYCPYLFSKGICLMEYGWFSRDDKIKSMIPLYNVIHGEKVYTGKFPITGLSFVILVVSLILRFIVIFTMPENVTVNSFTAMLFIICTFFYMISHMILVFRVLNDSGVVGIIKKIFLTIIFPMGMYYIGVFLPPAVADSMKDEETFG